VFLLGKDLNSFKEIAQGLLDGSPELRLAGSKDEQTRERLDALLKLYEQTRTQAGAILGNLQGLVSAREAQASIIADSEPLRRRWKNCRASCPRRPAWARPPARPGCSPPLFAIACAVGLAYVQLQDSRKPPGSAERSATKPSARSRKPSASTTPTRPPFFA
jgi:twitching motility protein PilJ